MVEAFLGHWGARGGHGWLLGEQLAVREAGATVCFAGSRSWEATDDGAS